MNVEIPMRPNRCWGLASGRGAVRAMIMLQASIGMFLGMLLAAGMRSKRHQ